jgi:hypothetical protein
MAHHGDPVQRLITADDSDQTTNSCEAVDSGLLLDPLT